MFIGLRNTLYSLLQANAQRSDVQFSPIDSFNQSSKQEWIRQESEEQRKQLLLQHLNQLSERQYVQDGTFKLYTSGEFYNWQTDPEEQQPLTIAQLDKKAAKSYQSLKKVLKNFETERKKHITE